MLPYARLIGAQNAKRDIAEARSLIDRRQDLKVRLAAAGLTPADIDATFKALTAQLELLERRLGDRIGPAAH